MKTLLFLSLLWAQDPNPFYSNSKQLTFVGPRSGEGYFSADGKSLIFQSERTPDNPFYQMFVMNLQTGKTTRLSPGHGQTTCGWIHPNMKKAMWSSTHLDPKWKQTQDKELKDRKSPQKRRYVWDFDPAYDIFESDLNGKNVKRLTTARGYDAEGSYSPDGQWIAFASNRSGYEKGLSAEEKALFAKDTSSQMEIYIMKADGTKVRRLTNSLGYDGGPFFSADGKKITWRRFSADGHTAEIWTMNVDGSEQRAITRLGKLSWAPYFHPSGDYLIFNSNIEGHANFELYIVDAQGTKEPVRVTVEDGFDGLASFSPNGEKLTWTHRNEKGESQIYMADWNDEAARKALGLAPKPRLLALSSDIRQADLKNLVQYLSSAEMQGRRTGSAEEKIYTAQIAELFKSWGLVPAPGFKDYFHNFEFISGVRFGTLNSFEVKGFETPKIYVLSQDFEPLSLSKTGRFTEAPIVFAGYGFKAPASDKVPAYDSYEGLDVKGKWVLALQDVPQDVEPTHRYHYNQFSRLEFKASLAKNEGALGLILVVGPRTPMAEKWGQPKLEGSPTEGGIAVLKLHTEAAKALLEAHGQNLEDLQKALDSGEKLAGFELKDLKAKAQVDLIVDRAQGRNVVARLKGKPSKGASALLLGAHGDHLGLGEMGTSLATVQDKDMIHYGADDNASGVALLLELAHYWSEHASKNKGSLKKDLYFAVWSGEELGLLGSKAWIKDWTKKNGALNKTFAAQLNWDMVGRLKDKLILQGVGSSPVWKPLFEELSVRQGLAITTQDDPYVPTDAMAFYMEKIPAITFFTGAHPEYHTPRDKADLILYPGLERITKFSEQLVRDLTWTPQKISYVDIPQSRKNQSAGGTRSFKIFLGTIPDYSQEGVKGVRISGVTKDSPAEKSGLKAQDVIVELAGQKVENLYDYMYALQNLKPGAEVVMKVLRTGSTQDLKIVPMVKE